MDAERLKYSPIFLSLKRGILSGKRSGLSTKSGTQKTFPTSAIPAVIKFLPEQKPNALTLFPISAKSRRRKRSCLRITAVHFAGYFSNLPCQWGRLTPAATCTKTSPISSRKRPGRKTLKANPRSCRLPRERPFLETTKSTPICLTNSMKSNPPQVAL